MITARFDMAHLRRQLTRAARKLGENNRQAVARWGVQTCRELAVSTQVFGKGNARKKQIAAIDAGIYSVICEVTDRQFAKMQSGQQTTAKIRNRWVPITPERLISTPDAANAWIEQHRGAKGHTDVLDQFSIAIAPRWVVATVRRDRRTKAGMAKGAWLGAGMAIARRQSGTNRINIGRNFLGYAQRHASRGDATASGTPFLAFADLANKAAHSGSSYVLRQSEKDKAVAFGARKTITWYNRAARESLNNP